MNQTWVLDWLLALVPFLLAAFLSGLIAGYIVKWFHQSKEKAKNEE